MKKLTLKTWVQVLLLIMYSISFILIMFIDINILLSLLGMIGCTIIMIILNTYGTIDKWSN